MGEVAGRGDMWGQMQRLWIWLCFSPKYGNFHGNNYANASAKNAESDSGESHFGYFVKLDDDSFFSTCCYL